jgi:hypothetical protein
MLLRSNLREMWSLLIQTDFAFSGHSRKIYDYLALCNPEITTLPLIDLLDTNLFAGGSVSFAYYSLTTYNQTLRRCGALRPVLQEVT